MTIKTLPDQIENEELQSLMKEWKLAGIEVEEFLVGLKRRRKRKALVVKVGISEQPYMSHPGGSNTYYTPARRGSGVWVKIPYERLGRAYRARRR
jgi:hypothetical protein